MVRRLAWAGIALLATYLVLVGGGAAGIYDWRVRLVSIVLTAGVLGLWAVVAWGRAEWRPRTVLWLPIALCLATFALSTVFSRNVRISLEYLAYAILLTGLYLLLVRLMANPFFRVRVVTFAAAMFVVIAVEFVMVVAWLWFGWWSELGRVALPPLRPAFVGLGYGNPSAVLTMTVLLAIPGAATWGRSGSRVVFAIVSILLTVGVVALLSGSRAGWLALGLTAIAGALAWVASADRRAALVRAMAPARASARSRRLAGSVILGAVGLVALAAVALTPAIAQRVSEGGEDVRATYAIVALRLFGQSPIVGVGPGMWVIERIAATHAPETDYYIPHAHDVPVQTLAEFGVLGAAAGVVFVVSVGLLIWRSIRSTDLQDRRWGWVAGLGLFYFALHDLLDFYPNALAVLFGAALPVAYLDARRLEQLDEGRDGAPARSWRGTRPKFPERYRRGLAAAAMFVVAVALLWTGWLQIPASDQASAAMAANTGDWAGALAPARTAAQEDSGVSPYTMTAGLAEARAGNHQAAAAEFHSVALSDDLPEAWLDYAAEQVEGGDKTGAAASIQRALRLGSQRIAILVAAGDLSIGIGEQRQAETLLASAVAHFPSLAGDPHFAIDHSANFRGIALGDLVVRDALALASPYVRWEIALESGDLAMATELAAQAGIGESLALQIIGAWQAIPGMLDQVVGDCRDDPFNLVLLGWCARLEARAGNEERASAFRDVADTVSVGSSENGFELRVRGTDRAGSWGQAAFWARYTYRNDGPADLLVPSLLHLELQ
jgi:O-Antigen ligase